MVHWKTSRQDFLPLLEGNARFRLTNRDFRELASSQDPKFIVISCSDSRVSPSLILDAPLGNLFEIRIAGEVVDETVIGSVEFAVDILGTKRILVIGHTGCGAVTAAYNSLRGKNPLPEGPGLASLVRDIYGAISKIPEENPTLETCIRENILRQADKLLHSEIIRKRSESGELIIGAALYHLDTGELSTI